MTALNFDVFWRDHGARSGLRGLGDGADTASHRMDVLKDSLKAGALAAGVALGAMAKKSIDVAKDIAESTSKISVVFGKSADSIMDFADTSAESLGISKRSALEAAGTFGNLLVSLKLPQAEAAKMSTRMITLAADMASFNNASPEEALDAIRSGLMGETEPLQRFGVNMNDATLRVQAMKMGLITSTKEGLEPAVKAQAAYGLMLAQTGTAQGDFARTSNGLANQTRILKARFEDLQGQLGEKLLPAATTVMSALVSLLDALGKNSDVVVPLVTGITALAGAIALVNAATGAATATMTAWNTVMGVTTLRTGMTVVSMYRLQAAMMAVSGAAVVVGAGIAAVWADNKLAEWDRANVSVGKLAEGMKAVSNQGKLSAAEIELFQGRLQVLGGRTDTSAEALKKFGWQAHDALDQGWAARIARIDDMGRGQKEFAKTTKSLDSAFASMVRDGNIDGAAAQMKLYEDAAVKAGLPVASLRKMFPEYTAAVAAAQKPIHGVTTALDQQEQALRRNRTQVKRTTEGLLGARSAENEFEESLDSARKALKDNGRTLDVHTEKGRENRTALDRVVTATLALRDASKKNGASISKQTQIMEHGRAELVRMGVRFGLTKRQAKAYADEVLDIPKRHDTTINTKTAAAERKIREFKNRTNAQLNAINDERVYIALKPPPGISLRQLMGDGDGVPPGVVMPPRSGPPHGHGDGFGVNLNAIAQPAGAGEMARSMRPTLKLYDDMAGTLGTKISAALQKKMMGNLGGGNASGGWRRQWAIVHGHFPSAVLTSAYRPGARTVSGNQSYHALGRAIDVTPSMAIFNWLRANYGAKTKELIYSPAGGRQIKNGRPHYYTGAVRAMHFNHVHWAYDNGGVATGEGPIWKGPKPERVLSATQTRSFDRLTRVLDRRPVLVGPTSDAPAIDYVRLGDQVANAFVRAGVTVKMDGRAVGTVLGTTSSLLGRAG